ncbi:Alpha beta hydrolase fold-5 protein [Madurella fahalii]|uniref:Alpha beta hydrolase fold-5 protein n=1 Tax=Madurella fahalii TaxID=1157608 RepID=A0ABQ0G054_9PEZI
MAGSSKKRDFQPESSWRMVEGGENDSFDTSIIHDDEEFIISSSDPLSQQYGSQPFSIGGSQPFSIGGSQDDSIESFLSKAENDEQVLLRSPFRPSVPQSVRQSSRDAMRHRSPEPEFYMPRVDVESPRRPNTRSAATGRGVTSPSSLPGLRQRQRAAPGSPAKERRVRLSDGYSRDQQTTFDEGLSAPMLSHLIGALSWLFGVVGHAFRYAQKPLAFLLSLYLTFGAVIMLQNMATKSLYTSLSPICRLPGVSWFDLPFCPRFVPTEGQGEGRERQVEFDRLMDVQDEFQQVLEKSAQGVSLPMEMKRSEASIRDLRTLVRYSNLAHKEELVLEFDGFIEAAGTASGNLQKFNTHVGSAVDSLISINRWTARFLDELDRGSHDVQHSGGLVGQWTSWLFSPFQPAVFSDRDILKTYIEHMTLVSEKVGELVLEGEAVLHILHKAGEHLDIIHDFVTRTQMSVQGRKEEILSMLWTLVGGNSRQLKSLNSQLSLLKQVDAQRLGAVKQVTELIGELEKVRAGLEDLRERAAQPGLLSGRLDIPLSVHVETIDRGVERLESARSRIRAIENERFMEVLARGKGGEKLIESM